MFLLLLSITVHTHTRTHTPYCLSLCRPRSFPSNFEVKNLNAQKNIMHSTTNTCYITSACIRQLLRRHIWSRRSFCVFFTAVSLRPERNASHVTVAQCFIKRMNEWSPFRDSCRRSRWPSGWRLLLESPGPGMEIVSCPGACSLPQLCAQGAMSSWRDCFSWFSQKNSMH